MINIKLAIFVVFLSLSWKSNGQFVLPVPENVTACVVYQENRTLLNVRWQDTASIGSNSAEHIIHYSSNSFNDYASQPLAKSVNNITGIDIPNDLEGEQLQIRVELQVIGRASNMSAPSILRVRPIYLASLETINITGNLTTLRLGFQLACELDDEVMCSVSISPRNSSNKTLTFSQTHNNISNLFNPTEVFLNIPNVTMGIEYVIRARLINSKGEFIGPEYQRTINISHPFNIIPVPTFAPSTSSSEVITTSMATVTPIDLTTTQTATKTNQIESTPSSSSRVVATDDTSSINIAIGVSVGCFVLMALSIALCIVIVVIKRNDKQKKKKSSQNSDDYSVPDESFVYANRFGCSSTAMLQNSTTDLIQACNGRHSSKNQKHDYSLPPDANYILYEETPQVPISQNNVIPSHYETTENQSTLEEPHLLNGHYEMSNTVMFDAAIQESGTTTTPTDYSELVHNSQQNGNDIPQTPMGGYDYDQLDQSVNNQDTAGPHYYDPVTNNGNQKQQEIKQSDGYAELQNSTTNHNQHKPYQILTNSNARPRHIVHQYEDVDNDNGHYSEPYKGKKLPQHDYDLVAGDVIPPPKRSFIREYSEPRDTLNIY